MKITKPAGDFSKEVIQRELQARMLPDAWLDLAHSIMVDWRKMKTIYTMQTRISFGLYHLKRVVRTNDIFFLGLDGRMRSYLYACVEGLKTEENLEDTVELDQFPAAEEAVYRDAARIAIERGGPVEFLDDLPSSEDIPERIHAIRKNMTLVIIPVYAHAKAPAEEKEDALVGAIGFLRPGERSPISEAVWMQLFYMVFEYGDAIGAALQEVEDIAFQFHLIPEKAAPAMTTWRDGVRCLSRGALDAAANNSTVLSIENAMTWLKGAAGSLGFANPHDMRPGDILHSIEKSLSRREADEISHSASATADEISKTASSAEWTETSGTILNTMGAIFERTSAVYFAMVNHNQDETLKKPDEFHIIHSRSTPSPNDEEGKALQVLAQWVGLTGEPLYLPSDEGCNKVLQQVREVTTQKVPIFAIPVYGWRKGKSLLHGVFIGFRQKTVARPSLAAWLTWVYTAQHMLSPIDMASRHGKLKYRPINVERSLARAAAPVEAMLLPWKSCKPLRKTKPIT
jgi:hypothetical protein